MTHCSSLLHGSEDGVSNTPNCFKLLFHDGVAILIQLGPGLKHDRIIQRFTLARVFALLKEIKLLPK